MTTQRVIVLSDKAVQIMNTPANLMPVVEDIYSIPSRGRGWFVVYTDPNREEKVVEKLGERNVESFCPRVVEWKPRTRAERDQKKPLQAISRPLLSRYLFARLPIAERAFGIIQAIDGVRGILGNGEAKIAVPDVFVDALRAREEAGDFNRTIKRGRVVAPKWAEPGVRVWIKDGPFSSFWATIEKCLSRDRVEVLVELFGREARAQLELAQIRKPC